MPQLELGVSEFVALLNQTLEYAYPSLVVIGELANLRVSKNRWLYFDLKDEDATVRCFGTIYHLPGPLEDGMMLRVKAQPRLHSQYGFSLNIQHIELSGEGSIKRAANLLEAKLTAEGIFNPERKRQLPYPPQHIGLIGSAESAAYSDFVKIIGERWGGLDIDLIDVQVQGQQAVEQIVRAIEQFNQQSSPPEVLVITRGGGSAEDLQAFSTEQVTRAIAASRIPTLVAIGHERDLSLAELASDKRASTPSNAAELLVPDRTHVLRQIKITKQQLDQAMEQQLKAANALLLQTYDTLKTSALRVLERTTDKFISQNQLLGALNPQLALKRGFVLLHKGVAIVRGVHDLTKGDIVDMTFSDGHANASVQSVYYQSKEQ